MPGIYRPRHPERTVLYRVLFHSFEQFLAEYEERFEKEYGFLRPIIKEVVERYLDCGNQRCGFARIRCQDSLLAEFFSREVFALLLGEELINPEIVEKIAIIAFLTDYAVVDRIINHLKLTFVAERPLPPRIAFQELLMAAETPAEYLS